MRDTAGQLCREAVLERLAVGAVAASEARACRRPTGIALLERFGFEGLRTMFSQPAQLTNPTGHKEGCP